LYSLTKAGAGTLVLGGSNTFTGGISVNAGRLILDNPSNHANSAFNRTLSVSAGAYLQLSEAMKLGASGSTKLTMSGAGTLEINPGSGNVVSLDNGAGNVVIAMSGVIDILSGTLMNGSSQGQNWSENTASLNIGTAGVFLPMDGSQVYIGGLNGSGTVGGPANTATTTGLVIGAGNGSGSFSGTITRVDGDLIKIGTGTQVLSGSSTYTGQTQIWNGVLSVAYVNSVFGGWTASNMGAPADAAHGTIVLGSLTTTGQLTYTGPGETTDRDVNLAGTTGGGILNQAGTGLLKFRGRVSTTGVGDKKFTLTGSTNGVGEFAAPIRPQGKRSQLRLSP
jgi:autotransporter-associated beta strand protein